MQILALVWDKWKKIARRIGVFQSRVILTIFYFTFLFPFGVIFTLFKDMLRIKSKKQSTWVEKINQTNSLELMQKQS